MSFSTNLSPNSAFLSLAYVLCFTLHHILTKCEAIKYKAMNHPTEKKRNHNRDLFNISVGEQTDTSASMIMTLVICVSSSVSEWITHQSLQSEAGSLNTISSFLNTFFQKQIISYTIQIYHYITLYALFSSYNMSTVVSFVSVFMSSNRGGYSDKVKGT